MNKYIIYLLLIAALLSSCDEESCDPVIIDPYNFYIEPIDSSLLDPCGTINKVACSIEFRAGKWLEIQDSLNPQIPDTIIFVTDSIAYWSPSGNPYLTSKTFFDGNHIYMEWSWGLQGPFSTSYDTSTQLFDIGFGAGGTQAQNYLKIE